MDHHSSDTKCFLLEPISPSIFLKPSVVVFHHWQGLDRMIQAVHHHDHDIPMLLPELAATSICCLKGSRRCQRTRCPDPNAAKERCRRPAAHAAAARAAHAAAARCPTPPPRSSDASRRHRLARPLPAARHSACRQGRRGRVAPTTNHGDAGIVRNPRCRR
ncbi:hypothetical protein ACLOJK_004748, partial [Asimina triloba]